MKYFASITSLVLVAAAVLAVVWYLPGEEQPTAVADTAEQPARVEEAVPEPLPEPEPLATEEETEEQAAVEEESDLPPGLTEEEARRERRRLELAEAAEARFNETVKADRIEPEQVEPAVRSMFKTVKLEPEFDPDQGREGFIDGMRISRLLPDNPLAQAGFEKGDRITRFNGQPLEDPSQVAHLFASLGTSFEVCAERGSGEYCRLINLPAN